MARCALKILICLRWLRPKFVHIGLCIDVILYWINQVSTIEILINSRIYVMIVDTIFCIATDIGFNDVFAQFTRIT